MSVILLKLAPWLAGIIVLLGVGGYAGYHLNPWQGRYQSLMAADVIARAHGEEAIRKTLADQLAQAQATSKNNADALEKLQDENAHIAADRDANLLLARRLLAGQARPIAATHSLPKASSGQASAATSGTRQNESLAGLLVDTADECERNADRLDALIAQITPQL